MQTSKSVKTGQERTYEANIETKNFYGKNQFALHLKHISKENPIREINESGAGSSFLNYNEISKLCTESDAPVKKRSHSNPDAPILF